MQGRSPRIRAWTFTMQPQHLPCLPNSGLCHVVLTYPATRALYAVSVRRLIVLHSGLPLPPVALACGSPFALLSPSDTFSQKCPCRRLILVLTKPMLTGLTYRGLSPHKFTPMPDVHNFMNRTPIKPGAGYDCVVL